MTFRLFAYILEIGGDSFPISIKTSQTVGELKKAILTENPNSLRGFDANQLILYGVDLPDGDGLEQSARHVLDNKLGPPSLKLSSIFSKEPPDETVSIIVKVPKTGGRKPDIETPPTTSTPSIAKAHLATVHQAQEAPLPSTVVASIGTYQSEQEKRPIYNGRPYKCRGLPVVIFDKSLANLKQRLGDLSEVPEPPVEYVRRTTELFCASAKIYKKESERGDQIWEHLCVLLGVPKFDFNVHALKANSMQKSTEANALFCIDMEDGTLQDGTLEDGTSKKKKAIAVYIELKNELGSGGDGGLQAALSLRKHVTQAAYAEMRDVSCCPCIVISIAGPFFQVSGAVLTDVFTIQCFTDYVYLGGNPYEMERIYHVAKIFYATTEAVGTLKSYYSSLRLRLGQPVSPASIHLLPHPTGFPNSPTPEQLIFKKRVDPPLHSGLRCLFEAEYGGKSVLVKFCETYGEVAHQKLAAEHLAPKLHYCSRILGGVFMVVMERVDGHDAFQQFWSKKLPLPVLVDVKRALKILHDADLVFGDVRRPNIMTHKKGDEDWHGLLVDFDWAGPVGKVKYPPHLNTKIAWAEGAASATEIKKVHDLEMLGKLDFDAEEDDAVEYGVVE